MPSTHVPSTHVESTCLPSTFAINVFAIEVGVVEVDSGLCRQGGRGREREGVGGGRQGLEAEKVWRQRGCLEAAGKSRMEVVDHALDGKQGGGQEYHNGQEMASWIVLGG